jgi:OOP family OmpA-OmpF porin
MQLKIYLLSALFLSILFLSPLQADNKFYLGASIGENYIEQDNVFLGEDFDDSDTGYKVFGGYQFHRNFAVEANYTEFGDTEDTIFGFDTEVEFETYGISLVGIAPITGRFDLFGKLGAAYWDAKVKVLGLSDSENGTDLSYGLGARFNFNEKVSVRGEYEVVDANESDLLDRSDFLSMGIEFNFQL